jgi:4-amino-4-deoxy-L-arabinose transferase-like glycosyltransferase
MSEPRAVTKKIGLFSSSAIEKASIFLGAGLCLAATDTHFFLMIPAEYFTGPLAVLDHIFDLVAAVAISFVVLSVGHSLISRFTLQFTSAAEKLSFSFLLGTGVVGLAILFLGLLGLLRPWSTAAMLLICVALTARDFPRMYQSVKQATRAALAIPEAIFIVFFIAFIGFLVLRTLTPPHVADELIYHLPVPQQFVQAGRVFPSYDNSLGNVPFLLHMIYTLCLMVRSDVAAKLFSLFVAVTTAISLYAFCRRFIRRRVGIVAMIAFFGSGMIVEIAVTTRIDVSLAGMLFASTYAMINYLATRARAWLWLSAVFAGFSLGIKHTAALWIFFTGILYLVETIRSRQSLGKILQLGVLYTVVALAVASPWYIKNAVWFHNPLYPFITGEVATFGPEGVRYFDADDERRLDAHFATARKEIPEIVSAQEQELRQAANSRVERHPLRWWEFFLKPNTYLMAEPYQFPNYLFILIPLIFLLKPNRWIWWLLILSLAFVFSVTLTSWIARYLVPAYPSLTIVAAYTLVTITARFERRLPIARRIPAYVTAVALMTVIPACIASMQYFRSVPYVAGRISRYDFLASLSFYRPLNFINQQSAPNARVLMIGAQMNYGLERPYYADESWFATKWRRLLVHNDSLEGVNRQLKAEGFTHVLYGRSLFLFAAQMGVEGTGGMSLLAKTENRSTPQSAEYPLLRNWSTFTLYQEKFLEPVYSDKDGYQIFRIK